jgi:hypothetical protein
MIDPLWLYETGRVLELSTDNVLTLGGNRIFRLEGIYDVLANNAKDGHRLPPTALGFAMPPDGLLACPCTCATTAFSSSLGKLPAELQRISSSLPPQGNAPSTGVVNMVV